MSTLRKDPNEHLLGQDKDSESGVQNNYIDSAELE
jgi:hypothetical protein